MLFSLRILLWLFTCGVLELHVFTARRYASAVLAVTKCLSICPSVRPSVTNRSCTKTAKPRITLITPYDSPGTLVFRCQKSRRNSNDITLNGAPNRGGVGSHRRFPPISRSISETVQTQTQTQLLRKANRNLYALYRMVLFSMTVGDP